MTQPPDLYIVALKMLGSLALVLLLVFGFFFFLKGFLQKGGRNVQNKLIQVLEVQYLGAKKNITAFKVPNGILIVGITHDSINLLAHLKDDECPDSLLYKDRSEDGTSFFNIFLRTFTKSKTTGEGHGKI